MHKTSNAQCSSKRRCGNYRVTNYKGPNHSDNWGKEVRGGNREGGGFEIVDHIEIVENREWGK